MPDGVVRSEHSPSSIIPQRGQVGENSSEVAPIIDSKEVWGVLHEDELRSHLANDSCELGPESAAISGEAGLLSGDGNVLTGKPARNDVNTASPSCSVKCANIVPDWKRLERFVVLPRGKDCGGVGVVLDSANSSPSEEFAAEYSSAIACE